MSYKKPMRNTDNVLTTLLSKLQLTIETDEQKFGMSYVCKTEITYADTTSSKVLIFNTSKQEKKICLKFSRIFNVLTFYRKYLRMGKIF